MKGHGLNLFAMAMAAVAMLTSPAWSEPTISLGQLEARPGGVAVAPVSIAGLPDGTQVGGLNVRILYPASTLSMPMVAYGPLMDPAVDALEAYSPRPGEINIIAVCLGPQGAFNANAGEVFYLVFQVSPQASVGQSLALTFPAASVGWPATPPTGLSDAAGAVSIAHGRVEGSVTVSETAPDPTEYPTVDSDGDGKPDGCETVSFALLRAPDSRWTNLYLRDSDGDGLLDGEEDTGDCPFTSPLVMTNPRNPDTDGDGFEDGMELLILGTDPLDPNDPDPNDPLYVDSNGDGIPDALKREMGLDVDRFDTSGNGFTDAYQIIMGSNPLDPDCHPGLGDVNGDGVTNNVDAILLLRYSIGAVHMLPEPNHGDVNRDGVFNNLDAVLIFNWTLKLLPHLPFG